MEMQVENFSWKRLKCEKCGAGGAELPYFPRRKHQLCRKCFMLYKNPRKN